MRPVRPSRRDILKGGVAATLAATAHGLNPRKTFAAREHKLVFWLQPNFNATADRILEEQIRAYAKQAGVKDEELQILKVPGGEISTRMTAALEVGAPPDITRTSEFLLPAGSPRATCWTSRTSWARCARRQAGSTRPSSH